MCWVPAKKQNPRLKASSLLPLPPRRFVSNRITPDLKTLQEQEEKDKKAAYRKNMEDRRLLASQKRAEELRVKAQDEDRKLREEAERRKREREENTADKRPTKKKVFRRDLRFKLTGYRKRKHPRNAR